MSLKYFLYCRKIYENIIIEIDNIINELNNIENNTNTLLEKEIFESFYTIYDKDLLLEKKEKFIDLKQKCNEKVMELCVHKFIYDYVDIFPDRCERIKYCKICDYTEK